MLRAPRFRGPAHLGKIIFYVRVNCSIASCIFFTTASVHWHDRLQHIRGNKPSKNLPTLLTWLDGFGAQEKLLSDCYDCIKEHAKRMETEICNF